MSDHTGHPARGEDDDNVHRADAGPEAFVDPAGVRTFCGQRVIELYNDRRDVTCPTLRGVLDGGG